MSQTVYTQTQLLPETGELIATKWIKRQVKNADHFVKMFLEDQAKLRVLSHSEYRILYTLASFLEYNTNQFFINQERREQIAEATGLKRNTINQSIARLVRKNLLIKVSSFTYQMNPKIFFNGEEIERSKYLDVTIRYEICEHC